jgi:proteasome assembly chaperone (PAC2) family protein
MSTDPIIFESRPSLKRPVLILAFGGWSDAGASATTAVRYLTEQLMAAKIASIDPEEFYDFSIQRPQVRLTEGMQREIHWPSYDLYHGAGIGVERDFVFGVGAEPHMRWRAFCEVILRLARECNVELIVTLGAYLDEVLKKRTVPLSGISTS